jgi:HSP20 family molecular chaperone IbpA
MMLATVKPNFQRASAFFPELNHFVNHVFNEASTHQKGFTPLANISEKESTYEIALAAPGFEKEHFAIKVEKENLSGLFI